MKEKTDRELIVETLNSVKTLSGELFGIAGRQGCIQRIEKSIADHSQEDTYRFNKTATDLAKDRDQLNYWRGAIALFGFIVVVLSTAFVVHIHGGK